MSYAINDDIIEQRLRQRCNTTCCKSGMHPSNVNHHVGTGHGVKVYTKGSGAVYSRSTPVQHIEPTKMTEVEQANMERIRDHEARKIVRRKEINKAKKNKVIDSDDVMPGFIDGKGKDLHSSSMSGGKGPSEWQKLIKKVSDERKMGLKDAIQHIKTNGLYKKKGSGTVFGKPNKVQPAPPEPGPGDGPHYHKSDVYADKVLRTTREIPNVLANIIGNYADDERDARNELGSNRIAKSRHDADEYWNRFRDALNNNSRPAMKFTDTKRGKQADLREKYIKHKYHHL